MTVKLPWIKWRDGRPRLTNGTRERALGFADADLRHAPYDSKGRPLGAWFTYEEAREASEQHHQKILAARAEGAKPKAAKPLRPPTLEDLMDDWMNSVEVQALSSSSISSYRKATRAVIYRPESRTEAKDRRTRERAAAVLGVAIPEREREPIASAPPSSIGAPELRDFFNYLKGARGHHMALAAISALSAAMTWGRESTKWRLARNPRMDMQFDRPDGRVVLITFEEFKALVAAADAIGRASIGDAIFLGLFTGQRQNDRLALKDEGLVDGRRQLKQSKTGMIVGLKEAPHLTARLAAAKVRVAALKMKLGLRDMPETIVVDETTGRQYNEHTYRHLFAEIRTLAIKGDEARGLQPCPSLAFINPNSGAPDFKHDQDLRDTCVILLDRAGNDLLSICDVTGHSYQSAQTIMKNYRARNAERADVAIDRLVAFMSKEGMTG
ncbi:hypothetical protein [Tardiphaga robiniae]|uniref:hypothetical protein n=1 Tax=Tardiphaga robiniae TaxID=943830 RepID=UPI0015869B2B|nr:hypothetical protein [Tardiphaga robiniae]NUU41413.1 hypothetical protein [Tardiphaga robiniae]